MQAFTYLHEEVQVIHNDVTLKNVLVTNSFTDDTVVQIVIIDFGKASKANSGKMYNLSDTEKSSYMVKYPYLAPELIEGRVKENVELIFTLLVVFTYQYMIIIVYSYCHLTCQVNTVELVLGASLLHLIYDPHQRKSCKP